MMMSLMGTAMGKHALAMMTGATYEGASPREKHDYYATHPKAITGLLKMEQFSKRILEPACGGGHISRELKKAGHGVRSRDLIDRDYGKVKDFFKTKHWEYDIVTNPPYVLAQEFILHSMKITPAGSKIAMFFRLAFLESKGRKPLFEKYPPIRVLVSSERLNCAKGGDFVKYPTGGLAYAWFVWINGHKGDTQLKWF